MIYLKITGVIAVYLVTFIVLYLAHKITAKEAHKWTARIVFCGVLAALFLALTIDFAEMIPVSHYQ